MTSYSYTEYAMTLAPELSGATPGIYPVVIVGAGPIGLSAAIDLALHGVPSVVLDENNVVSVGSRAICWAKRSLEIFDRLGVAQRMLDKGVIWKVGRVYHRDREIHAFDLLPEEGHRFPAFVNLQQYYVEQYLIERCWEFPDLIDLRFLNQVTAVLPKPGAVTVRVDTPDGDYTCSAHYVLACDGARSTVRSLLGLGMLGETFEDRFLIADIEMTADFPSERRFWFEPSFHPGQSALLHKQPENIYRIDLQLGANADPERETMPEAVVPRIEKVVQGRPFALDWVSVYSFQCRRLERFLHGRVLFVGDSAHVVSPFGARGGNGGIHDVDNLCWKLAAVLQGSAGPALLESYNDERIHGADENILQSARTTRFMSPHAGAERLFRDETLALARDLPFARGLMNPGRLSTPCSLAGFPLQTPAETAVPARMAPGQPCLDAPVTGADGRPGWLLAHLGGTFRLLAVNQPAPSLPGLPVVTVGAGSDGAGSALGDPAAWVEQRYGDGLFLIRPDQHVAAHWPAHGPPASPAIVAAAWRRALGFMASKAAALVETWEYV